MTPSERVMPVVNVIYDDMLKRWIVSLPGGIKMAATDTLDAEAIIAKHAPGSSARFYRVAEATEAEKRELWGR